MIWIWFIYESQRIQVQVPAWVRDAVFYEIFPEHFANGDPTNDHPLAKEWSGRPELFNYWGGDLAKILGYTEYGKFKNAIQKAEEACQNSDQAVSDHFAHVSDMIEVGKGARCKVDDVHLSRYACYL